MQMQQHCSALFLFASQTEQHAASPGPHDRARLPGPFFPSARTDRAAAYVNGPAVHLTATGRAPAVGGPAYKAHTHGGPLAPFLVYYYVERIGRVGVCVSMSIIVRPGTCTNN